VVNVYFKEHVMDLLSTQELHVLEVSDIRRRKDGIYLIFSNDKVALFLSGRQMRIVVAAANARFGYLTRSELHRVVYPDRPGTQLSHAVLTASGIVSSFPVPLSPGQRASLSRSMRRLQDFDLIERPDGEAAKPTESAKAIAAWIDAHAEVLEENGG
jgi:hypothetical protein